MRKKENNDSKIVFAFILIGIGIFWALKKMGIYFEFSDMFLENIVYPLQHFLHKFSHTIFSWPMILIVTGAILAAKKRPAGIVLLLVGIVYIIPKIFFLHELTLSLLFPIILIGTGIAIMAKKV